MKDDDLELCLVGAERLDPRARRDDGGWRRPPERPPAPRPQPTPNVPRDLDEPGPLHVSPRDGGWTVERDDGEVLFSGGDREDVLARARFAATERNVPLVVHQR